MVYGHTKKDTIACIHHSGVFPDAVQPISLGLGQVTERSQLRGRRSSETRVFTSRFTQEVMLKARR
ncbi:hypothetical protein EYF80_043416 [Liparis tanakae]|uniref:Uncharacterized protein n=1 Tax=Liparis tanakae TaxID=230148 RepID=A0A4Z2G0G6_9TELE|nr:hypothetical protein EYF80_043416 [Liparis tanakae]